MSLRRYWQRVHARKQPDPALTHWFIRERLSERPFAACTIDNTAWFARKMDRKLHVRNAYRAAIREYSHERYSCLDCKLRLLQVGMIIKGTPIVAT